MNNLKGMGLDLTKRRAQKESHLTQLSFLLSQQQPPSPTSRHTRWVWDVDEVVFLYQELPPIDYGRLGEPCLSLHPKGH